MQVSGAAARLVCVLLLLDLAACGGDPRKPSKSTLEPAINTHLAANPKCVGEPAWMLPVTLPNADGSTPGYQAIIDRLHVAVRLGLVSSTPADQGTSYVLTEAGRRVYRTFPAGSWDPRLPVGAFCYGIATAAEIVRWTEPAEALGQVVTEVTYLSRLGRVEQWAEDAELRRHFPYLEKELATRTTPAEGRMTLVLSSDGWRAPRR